LWGPSKSISEDYAQEFVSLLGKNLDFDESFKAVFAVVAAGGASASSTAATNIVGLLATPTAANTNMDITVKETSGTGTLLYTLTVTVAPANGFYNYVATGICTAIDATTGLPEALSDDSGTIVLTVGGTLTIDSSTADMGVRVGSNLLVTSTEGGADVDPNGQGVSTDVDAAENVVIKAVSIGTSRVSGFLAAAPGTTTDFFDITVVAGCATSGYSAATSLYETSSAAVFANLLVPTDGGFDNVPDGEVGSTYTFPDDDSAIISISGANAYGAALPVGVWVASATGAAIVSITADAAAAAGVTSVASLSAPGDTIGVAVEQATPGTALNTVVTVSYNGVTVYSKSILFTGDVASLTVSGVDVQAVGGNTLKNVYDVVAKDAAGNLLIVEVAGDAATYTSQVTSITGGFTTKTGTGKLDATNDNTDDSTIGSWTCAASSGKSAVRLKATANSGATVYSNTFDALCGNAAYTYTASLDKASYVPGDIATLTITAKDASGFAPFKNETVDAAAGVPSIAGSQLTAVNTPIAADVFNASGVKTYTFTVGSTSGKYNMAVNLGYTGNSAVAVSYSVASSGEVSNAQVLQSIVALIASINKQIQALQKLILARR
jgi:hypothetical protein